jgi:bifunctional NMN adenylyltransferase/nudix hydrolase
MAKKDVCVYIGRFNPFHLGHAYVLEQALKTSKLVIVLIGSAGAARSPKNPFKFAERKAMIEKWALGVNSDAVLRILPVRDFASNNVWITSVHATVKSAMTAVAIEQNIILNDVYLTGSDRDDSTWYLNAFPQYRQALVPAMSHKPGDPSDLSATSVRKILYESDLADDDLAALSAKLPQSSIRYIDNFIRTNRLALEALRVEYNAIKDGKAKWAGSPFPVTFQTADAVIIQSGHVLLIRRGNQPGYGLWALPGGYVNQHERIRDAAVREAEEETGIRLTTGKNAVEITKKMLDGSIRAKELFDDPNRSERGRIITMAYLMRLDDTRPLPKVEGQNVPYYESDGKEIVETLEAKWVPLDRALELTDQWFEDHLQILEWAVAQLDN